MFYVLFNPLSNNKDGEAKAKSLTEIYGEENVKFEDVTRIEDYKSFFESIEAEDSIVLCGGDGTLNRFVNDTYDLDIPNDILYFPCGSGNDFWRDLEIAEEKPVSIKETIKNLPTVIVNGKEYKFLNGVGYGIDGYCCEVGDRMRADPKHKKISYTSIAIKGLLFHYKPKNATVTVDGEKHEYKKVWICPTMVGRYYGGGMMPAPAQRREDREDHVSLSLLHSTGKFKTLMIFPSLFKGEHIKHTKKTAVFQGKHIIVEFDEPCALQIDGETILGVTKYEVRV